MKILYTITNYQINKLQYSLEESDAYLKCSTKSHPQINSDVAHDERDKYQKVWGPTMNLGHKEKDTLWPK